MDAAEAKGQQIQRTWKPIVAGIADIICSTVPGMLAAAILACERGISGSLSKPTLIIIAAFFFVACLAFAGGISAIVRKNWGLAIAGSAAAAVVFWPLGVTAIIFIALSKSEFE